MEIKKIDDYRWEVRQTGAMRVPGRVYTSSEMLKTLQQEEALKQVANVATLPGIVKFSLAMPDIHWGYGFPIGGVAAFDWQTGIISPGGVGYDINCGVRLATTSLEENEARPKMENLVNSLYLRLIWNIPRMAVVCRMRILAQSVKGLWREGESNWEHWVPGIIFWRWGSLKPFTIRLLPKLSDSMKDRLP
jgi:hypothetical protein